MDKNRSEARNEKEKKRNKRRGVEGRRKVGGGRGCCGFYEKAIKQRVSLVFSQESFLQLSSTFPVLPVAQRAMKVCACFRMSDSLSSGRGSLCKMCSIKSCGVTAAIFHFNFPSTTSSQSCRGWGGVRETDGRGKKKHSGQVTTIPKHHLFISQSQML